MGVFALAFLHAASEMPFTAPQQELTLQQVLKANTAAVQAIRSLHVTIAVSNNLPAPGETKPPEEVQSAYVLEWFKDENRLRESQVWLRGRGPETFDVHSHDRSNGPNGFKAIYNFDPNEKPPLSESFASHAYGEIDKTRPAESLNSTPAAMSYMIYGGVRLEDYLAKYPSSKLAMTPANSKFGCYEIITSLEKGQEANYDICDLRIFLDPKVGFWIRRIERGPWQKTTVLGDKGTSIIDVQEFKDCDNGIFWPLRAYHRTRLPGGTSGPDIFVRHTLHSINQPIPEEDFAIHFPDWLRVFDRRSGKVLIWGSDNQPQMTFASEKEYKEWYKQRAEDLGETPAQRRSRWVWVAGISVLVGLMLGFTLWRRSKSSHHVKTVPVNLGTTSPPSAPERR